MCVCSVSLFVALPKLFLHNLVLDVATVGLIKM